MELLLVVDRKRRADGKDRKRVERFLEERRVLNQLRGTFNPERIKSNFYYRDGKCLLHNDLEPIDLFKGYKFNTQPGDLNLLTKEDLNSLEIKLAESHLEDNYEEAIVLIELISKERDLKVIKKLQRRVLVVYKKLAFKKYRDIFTKVTKILDLKVNNQEEGFKELKIGIDEIKEIAKMRFKG